MEQCVYLCPSVRQVRRWLLGKYSSVRSAPVIILTGQQYRNVDIHSGNAIYFTVDSLSAFWPGLQVLAGDVQNAVKAHLMCGFLLCDVAVVLSGVADWNLWRRHSGLPEVWDINFRQATSHQYPLRPGESVCPRLFRSTILFLFKNLSSQRGIYTG
jgi:hypothetical protein